MAFSLGIIVPLYNREYIERKEIIPYILGANISTLIDTFLIAILLGTTSGAFIVLFLIFITVVITILFLIFHEYYLNFINKVQENIITSRKMLAIFLFFLIFVPLVLLFFR